jgi:hypothetical protein
MVTEQLDGKAVPLIVTSVPPVVGPVSGDIVVNPIFAATGTTKNTPARSSVTARRIIF